MMRKVGVIVPAGLFLASLLVAGGCGAGHKQRFSDEELAQIPLARQTALPECSGGMVLAVAGEVITADELIAPLTKALAPAAARGDFEEFERYARPRVEEVARIRIAERALFREARKDIPGDIDEALEKAAQQEVKRFISEFGGNYAQAEKKLKEDGFDWQSFREYKKRVILTQSYLAKRLGDNKPIVHSQLLQHYERIKHKDYALPAELKFRLIDIQPSRLEVENPTAGRRERAKGLAEQLVKRIRAGEDFGKLAREYSHGHRASAGGLWKPVQPGSLAEPYDVIETACESLEPGQVARPIETAEHIFIVKLEDRQAEGFEPFEKVQQHVQAKLILQQRRVELQELMAKLTQQAEGPDLERFIDFCVQKIYHISRNR